MGKFVLKNVRPFVAGADLTTRSNRFEISMEAESKDATAFAPSGDVWHEELSGIRTVTVDGAGQWEAGDLSMVDDSSFANLGATTPLTLCPQTAADGSLCYLTAFNRQAYSLGGAVGDVVPWGGHWVGNWGLARGLVTATPAARTTTGTGTIQQYSALATPVAAGQYLVGSLHVMGISGTATPGVTLTIQTAATAGFASPTTRLTFNAQTTLGGQIFRIAGPITDQYIRASWTITGTTPSLLFMSAIGVSA
jgi:hypothetical protein